MKVNTEVRSVQVYRNGCTAVRKGQVQLEEGKNQVLIEGLTSSAYTDTMRLRFPQNVKASAIHVIERSDDEEKESDRIAEEIRMNRAKAEALGLQAEMWKNNSGFANLNNATVSEVENYIIAYPGRIESIKKQINDLEKERKKLEKQLNKAHDAENRPLISAELSTDHSGTYPFELIYQETAASWNSMYEIHTDAEKPLEIRVRAEIRQKTGEDGKDVNVTLRTGAPSFSASVPYLRPCSLEFRKPRPQVYGSSGPMLMKAAAAPMMARNEMAMEDSAMGDTAMLETIRTEEAEISAAETMTEYILASAFDISSGSDGLTVDLQSFELNAKYRLIAVPKADMKVCLTAEIRTEDLPVIVNGNAAVYLNEMYTGTVLLAPDRTEETFAVVLGNEERISVFREEKRKKGQEALIRNLRSEDYETEIRIVSAKDEPVTIVIKDQIPVSREQAITVDVKQTDKAEHDAETGELKWELELKPREIRTLHIAYRISWPKDKTIEYR